MNDRFRYTQVIKLAKMTFFSKTSPGNDLADSLINLVKSLFILKCGNDVYWVCIGRFWWFLVIGTDISGQICQKQPCLAVLHTFYVGNGSFSWPVPSLKKAGIFNGSFFCYKDDTAVSTNEFLVSSLTRNSLSLLRIEVAR